MKSTRHGSTFYANGISEELKVTFNHLSRSRQQKAEKEKKDIKKIA
jgi:hypothetical protein